MKKFLISMTTACLLFSFGDVTELHAPGEPIGISINDDEHVVDNVSKEKIKKPKNGEPRLDPGDPTGS
ncbi:hypothetical protein FZW96_16000 [Bacillus sp. BGMRC 2118]|nr:hypothetical protein FZW96_16000 [Bacillus sp. BGMRC 2118]